MRLESSYDMGDPREISCSSGTMELRGQTERRRLSQQKQTVKKPKYECMIAHTLKDTFVGNQLSISSPSDHFRCHGSYQVPEVPQETCIES